MKNVMLIIIVISALVFAGCTEKTDTGVEINKDQVQNTNEFSIQNDSTFDELPEVIDLTDYPDSKDEISINTTN